MNPAPSAQLICDGCKARIKAPPTLPLGRKLACPGCKAPITVGPHNYRKADGSEIFAAPESIDDDDEVFDGEEVVEEVAKPVRKPVAKVARKPQPQLEELEPDDDDEDVRPSRAKRSPKRRKPKKAKSRLPMLLGSGVGLLVVVGLIVVFVGGGSGESGLPSGKTPAGVTIPPQNESILSISDLLPGPIGTATIRQNGINGSPSTFKSLNPLLVALTPSQIRAVVMSHVNDKSEDYFEALVLTADKSIDLILQNAQVSSSSVDGQKIYWAALSNGYKRLSVFWQPKSNTICILELSSVSGSSEAASKAYREFNQKLKPMNDSTKLAFKLVSGYPVITLNPAALQVDTFGGRATGLSSDSNPKPEKLFVFVQPSRADARASLQMADQSNAKLQADPQARELLRDLMSTARWADGKVYFQFTAAGQ